MEKTNVMRILDQRKIKYTPYDYTESGLVAAKDVASFLGVDENQLFKTLVTTSKSNNHYVFVVPASSELDLKKAAKAVNEKNIELIHQKELLPLTGYIHGGCSPIGMKKFFKTVFDSTATKYDTIFISGGKVGISIQVSLNDLSKIIRTTTSDLIKE